MNGFTHKKFNQTFYSLSINNLNHLFAIDLFHYRDCNSRIEIEKVISQMIITHSQPMILVSLISRVAILKVRVKASVCQDVVLVHLN